VGVGEVSMYIKN